MRSLLESMQCGRIKQEKRRKYKTQNTDTHTVNIILLLLYTPTCRHLLVDGEGSIIGVGTRSSFCSYSRPYNYAVNTTTRLVALSCTVVHCSNFVKLPHPCLSYVGVSIDSRADLAYNNSKRPVSVTTCSINMISVLVRVGRLFYDTIVYSIPGRRMGRCRQQSIEI